MKHAYDPAAAILYERMEKKPLEGSGERISLIEKAAGVAGLGIAYAGTDSEDRKNRVEDCFAIKRVPGLGSYCILRPWTR